MGAEKKAKLMRRIDRRIQAELEKAGVVERGRMIYLGLKRPDVQAKIREKYVSHEKLQDRPSLIAVVCEALKDFGYDLDGIEITARTLPGRHVVVDGEVKQEPYRVEFVADASPEAIAAARLAAGIKSKGTPPQVPVSNRN